MNNSLRLDFEFPGDLLDEESKERYRVTAAGGKTLPINEVAMVER